MEPSIPGKQRELVDRQLKDMYAGRPPDHFCVLRDIFGKISTSSGDRQEPLRVLDAGCASGYYFEILRHLVPVALQYTGSDFSQGMLELARQRYPQLSLVRTDVRQIAWRDQSFDIVLSGAVIVHVREWERAVTELGRVARKWVVLHRTLVCFERSSFVEVEKHYDVDVYRVYIREAELMSLLCNMGYELVLKMDCQEGISRVDVGNFTYLFLRKNGPLDS